MTIALRLWRLTHPSRGTHSRHHRLPNDISCVMQGSQTSLEYSLCHPDHISCVIQGSQLSPEYSLCHPNHKSCVIATAGARSKNSATNHSTFQKKSQLFSIGGGHVVPVVNNTTCFSIYKRLLFLLLFSSYFPLLSHSFLK